MIRAGFYAPMKPPDDPIPSGDRTLARNLMAALAAAGIEADLASRLRSRDGTGDVALQDRLIAQAQDEIAGTVATGRARNWRLWVTYHNYYKAPDLIGPSVARTLDIPYVLVEATRARKRLDGPWARFAEAAEAASDAAAVILYPTARDGAALAAYRRDGQRLVHLRPFLPVDSLPAESTRNGGMLSVGMMRDGDKLASYRLIAESLAQLSEPHWQLSIAGDGPARGEIEALMRPFGDRVRFLGACDAQSLAQLYGEAGLLLWPGVNEAFGMVYLEAQAAGVPVLAQDRPGVRDVLAPGAAYPSVDGGANALADRLQMLLAMPKLVRHLGSEARTHVARHHLLGTAARTLGDVIREVLQ